MGGESLRRWSPYDRCEERGRAPQGPQPSWNAGLTLLVTSGQLPPWRISSVAAVTAARCRRTPGYGETSLPHDELAALFPRGCRGVGQADHAR